MVTYGLYTQLIADDAPAYGSAEAEAIRAGGYTLLQEGDSGEAVTRLQTRLVELGYANGTPNGRYASATVSAVKLFQRAVGLEETGVATAALQALLYADDAPAYSARGADERRRPLLSLRPGHDRSCARAIPANWCVYLQTRLAQLGYFERRGGRPVRLGHCRRRARRAAQHGP